MDESSVAIDTAPKLEAPVSPKSIACLFFLYLLVTSDMFANSILRNFSGAVCEREITNVGILVSDVFLVILYVMALYFIRNEVI